MLIFFHFKNFHLYILGKIYIEVSKWLSPKMLSKNLQMQCEQKTQKYFHLHSCNLC